MSNRDPLSQPATDVARAPLPRAARLLKPADFKQVFKNNQASNDSLFRIIARANPNGRSRLGMAVSRKVDRSAVGRNRIKRVVRENFRNQLAGQILDSSLDFIVMPTNQAARESNKVLDESLTVHWQQLIRKTEESNIGYPQDRLRTQR